MNSDLGAGQYVIEKGIPMPPQRRTRRSRYPFADMGVGDCFTVLLKDGDDLDLLARRITSAANGWRASSGNKDRRFSVRRVAGDAVRVWRTV